MPQHSGAGSIMLSTGAGAGSDSTTTRWKPSQISRNHSSDMLQLPNSLDRSISPSQIAASLAASRSVSTTPNHTGQRTVSLRPALNRQGSSSGRSSTRSNSRAREALEDKLDTTSIPPTTSLIGMFEESTGTTPLKKRPKPTAASNRPQAPEVHSPKPIRPPSVAMERGVVQSQKPETKPPKPLRPESIAVKQKPGQSSKPALPPPRTVESQRFVRKPPVKPKPNIQKEEVEDDASSDDSFVSAPDHRPHSAMARRPRRSVSASAIARARKIDAMANVIVAASLASSRAASPSRITKLTPPLPPPRRGSAGLFHHHHHQYPSSGTASPAKVGMRQTLRKPSKDDEEEDDLAMQRRGRKNLMKKHPNKHHEGDRKRWRDSVTERERKRYDAVWASNRGLYVTDHTTLAPPPASGSVANVLNSDDLSNCVCNLVVRDIWSRSRLGPDVLAEVWDLVDRSGTGKLTREEFVIGLWLIDQRLKGRKLPVKVGESVWSSIAALGGIKIKGNGRKR